MAAHASSAASSVLSPALQKKIDDANKAMYRHLLIGELKDGDKEALWQWLTEVPESRAREPEALVPQVYGTYVQTLQEAPQGGYGRPDRSPDRAGLYAIVKGVLDRQSISSSEAGLSSSLADRIYPQDFDWFIWLFNLMTPQIQREGQRTLTPQDFQGKLNYSDRDLDLHKFPEPISLAEAMRRRDKNFNQAYLNIRKSSYLRAWDYALRRISEALNALEMPVGNAPEWIAYNLFALPNADGVVRFSSIFKNRRVDARGTVTLENKAPEECERIASRALQDFIPQSGIPNWHDENLQIALTELDQAWVGYLELCDNRSSASGILGGKRIFKSITSINEPLKPTLPGYGDEPSDGPKVKEYKRFFRLMDMMFIFVNSHPDHFNEKGVVFSGLKVRKMDGGRLIRLNDLNHIAIVKMLTVLINSYNPQKRYAQIQDPSYERVPNYLKALCDCVDIVIRDKASSGVKQLKGVLLARSIKHPADKLACLAGIAAMRLALRKREGIEIPALVPSSHSMPGSRVVLAGEVEARSSSAEPIAIPGQKQETAIQAARAAIGAWLKKAVRHVWTWDKQTTALYQFAVSLYQPPILTEGHLNYNSVSFCNAVKRMQKDEQFESLGFNSVRVMHSANADGQVPWKRAYPRVIASEDAPDVAADPLPQAATAFLPSFANPDAADQNSVRATAAGLVNRGDGRKPVAEYPEVAQVL
ncbi:MAG: hypothetical protein EBX40_02525 [Gammaproteobacteria bacterium]|nr:hypothetical protein [Gammaproteobacteria bacterium]